MAIINVMIVDDSLMIRAILKNLIESDEKKRFKVVASALDGFDALQKAKSHDINVILMDVEMPRKNGLETLKELMKENPKPVVMFSSLTKEGAKETIEALSIGAVDFLAKPQVGTDIRQLKGELLEKLHHASLARLTTVRTTLFSPVFKSQTPERITKKELSNLIVIGTSTGGPNALRTILPQLKKDSPAAILIVQHMPEGTYTASLANYLNSGCHFHVKEGKEGDIVSDGNVYIAPGGYHMDIIHRGGHYQLVLNKKEPVTGHRPSVDAIMRSVLAADINVPVFAVILTGMGSDGTRGIDDLKRERKRPLSVIAESKETVVIYGMPRQVIEHGLADHVLPLTDIIPHIEKKIK